MVRDLKARIRDSVMREHGLALKRVLLVPQGALPLTTSGKIQRSYAQKLLIEQQFREVWEPPAGSSPPIEQEELS